MQVRKDDIVGNVKPEEQLAVHSLITDNMPLFQDYVKNCRAVIDLMLEHLNTQLGLEPGTLAHLHRITERSGDHVRFTQAAVQPYDETRAKSGEHTDFGSITVLFNWLGGLQIRHPDTDQWVYVKPVPGSAVINLGDAMVKFTAGILRSNIHRVVPPAGDQAKMTRNSLVYFSRPEDAVILKRLPGGVIDKQPKAEAPEEEMNSNDWIMRRSLGDLRGIYTKKGGLEPRPFEL
jgi:isopenicillin N synthase-like dioxygenase